MKVKMESPTRLCASANRGGILIERSRGTADHVVLGRRAKRRGLQQTAMACEGVAMCMQKKKWSVVPVGIVVRCSHSVDRDKFAS